MSDGREKKIRADIVTKFGSIPKMAKAIDLPQNTIYHALERGLDNTTSKTRSAILEALYDDAQPQGVVLSADERELLELYRSLSARGQNAVLVGLREYAGK